MKNFSTWMLVLFMIMFWVFRVIVVLMDELNLDFGGIEPLYASLEIILCFVVFVCIILVVKRKMIGGLLYLLSYGMYFGVNVYDSINGIINVTTESASNLLNYTNIFISIVAMILAVAVVLDLLADKSRKLNPKDKKTDWFYKNKDFDRKLDDRADKNNYRTL